MHILKTTITYFTFCCFGLVLLSCEGRREVEGNNEIAVDTAEREDTATVARTGETSEERLEEFRGWLNEKVYQGDTAIRNDWPQVREKLRQRNAELEQGFDSLSARSKQEFRDLQGRYERWEEREERRRQQPLAATELDQWQDQLLRDHSDLSTITPDNIREAYLTFIGVVRAKRRNWTQSDWDHVDHVYAELNDRRRQLEGRISTRDNLKIRALQAEYLALEGAADTRSIIRDAEN